MWNVGDRTALANFSGHNGRVLTGEWNALEADTVVTGSDDFTVRVWNVDQQEHKNVGESLAARLTKDERKKAALVSVNRLATAAVSSSVAKKKLTKLKSLFPVGASLEARGRVQGLLDCKILATARAIPLVHSESLVNHEIVSQDDFGSEPWANLGFFGDSHSTARMLDTEIEQHVKGSNLDLAAYLQLCKGGPESVIRQAVKAKTLTEFLVSLAPQVSIE